MEEAIRISTLNDFIFCPRSIYFHNVYSNFDEETYYDTPQIEGRLAHRTIDNEKYSSRKEILQGIGVFSEELGLIGKIDLLNIRTKTLIERKKKIQRIYEGYLLQLYAQYFCLVEMGYHIQKLILFSITDNKKYPVPLPGKKEKDKLKEIIRQMQEFSLDRKFTQNPNKCRRCIYCSLCDVCTYDEQT